MKNLLLPILLAASALTASAEPRWLSQTHDFGAFSEDLGAVDALFQYVNDSDKPVRILSARATCGCMVPEVPKEAVEPGDTVGLRVTYLATGRPGRFSKNVYVRTSANPSEQRTLTVKGVVIGSSATLASRYPITAGPMKMRSQTVGFGEVVRGRLKTVFIDIYNQSADTLRPSLAGVPDYIKFAINPAEVPPGEQSQLVFTLQTLEVPEWGITSEKFSFTPGEGLEPVEMDFFTIVTEDFGRLTPGERINAPIAALEPARVDFGFVEPSDVREVEFTVTNSGKSPLLVRRLQAVDSALSNVEISSKKIRPGKSAKITATVNPAESTTGFVNARITLITNDPENSLLTARVTAEIAQPK